MCFKSSFTTGMKTGTSRSQKWAMLSAQGCNLTASKGDVLSSIELLY